MVEMGGGYSVGVSLCAKSYKNSLIQCSYLPFIDGYERFTLNPFLSW